MVKNLQENKITIEGEGKILTRGPRRSLSVTSDYRIISKILGRERTFG